MQPFLPSPLRSCVELQWVTGMRPSEALRIKMTELDRSGDVWLYTVRRHKNRWRSQPRVVALGPEARSDAGGIKSSMSCQNLSNVHTSSPRAANRLPTVLRIPSWRCVIVMHPSGPTRSSRRSRFSSSQLSGHPRSTNIVVVSPTTTLGHDPNSKTHWVPEEGG